jgi:protein-tyrosine-phosphatase
MAEAIFRHLLALHPHPGTPIHVESAGVDALVGESPDASTQSVCREHNTEVARHKARQVTADMIEGVDLVLCLAEEHKRLILGAYPRFKGKVFLLMEYHRDKPVKKLSVDDPTGRSTRQYEKCYNRIEEEVTRIYKLTTTPIDGTMPMISVSR